MHWRSLLGLMKAVRSRSLSRSLILFEVFVFGKGNWGILLPFVAGTHFVFGFRMERGLVRE